MKKINNNKMCQYKRVFNIGGHGGGLGNLFQGGEPIHFIFLTNLGTYLPFTLTLTANRIWSQAGHKKRGSDQYNVSYWTI